MPRPLPQEVGGGSTLLVIPALTPVVASTVVSMLMPTGDGNGDSNGDCGGDDVVDLMAPFSSSSATVVAAAVGAVSVVVVGVSMMMGVVVVDDDVFVGVDMTGPEGVYGGSNPLHARIDPKQSTKQMTNDK